VPGLFYFRKEQKTCFRATAWNKKALSSALRCGLFVAKHPPRESLPQAAIPGSLSPYVAWFLGAKHLPRESLPQAAIPGH
jgi:hypothetical protein